MRKSSRMAPKEKQTIEIEKTHRDPLPSFNQAVTVDCSDFLGTALSGNMTVVLADGEVCKGHWATVARPPVAKAGATASTAPDSNMSSVWDTIYGSGFYVSHVLGQRLYVQAVIPGNRGTVLKVEMYRSAGGA